MTGNRNRRVGRPGAAAALAVAAVVLLPSAAWGHAEFVSQTSVPARTDQKLTINVPEEKGPDVHNTKVVFVVPAGFAVSGCEQKPEWTCEVSGASEGRTLVTYVRSKGTDPDGHFSFGVRTPDKGGDYPFPTNQTYSDNTTNRWSGPPDSDNPAPVLKVT
ncbi:MAG TPA: DUF1775 domain-containing protein [Acidimicrobiia bacterium]|nr:DUF1775 domain-containing protein [Acidimicrobiia bacterium]